MAPDRAGDYCTCTLKNICGFIGKNLYGEEAELAVHGPLRLADCRRTPCGQLMVTLPEPDAVTLTLTRGTVVLPPGIFGLASLLPTLSKATL